MKNKTDHHKLSYSKPRHLNSLVRLKTIILEDVAFLWKRHRVFSVIRGITFLKAPCKKRISLERAAKSGIHGVARLAFFMPTFSNLAYCKVVGSKK